jgi:hypothetical protein
MAQPNLRRPRVSVKKRSNPLPTRREVQEAYAAVHINLRQISQEALAERSGTSKDYQYRLENAQRCPNLWIFIKNSMAMDVDPVLVLSMVMRRLRGEI